MNKKIIILISIICIASLILIPSTEAGWWEDTVEWFREILGIANNIIEIDGKEISSVLDFNKNHDYKDKTKENDDIKVRDIFRNTEYGGVKHEINIENLGLTAMTDYNYSTIIEIKEDVIRWNGTEYQLTSKPIRLQHGSYNIFFGENNRRINFRHIGELGGYAQVSLGKVELIIEGININAKENYFIDPTYYNQTDGFDVSGIGISSAQGMAGNGTNFWIWDSVDEEVYHVNAEGVLINNFNTDIMETSIFGVGTNDTDIWLSDYGGDFIAHFDYSGNNQSDYIDTGILGSSNPYSFVNNATDFWIYDHTDKYIYHRNRTGNDTDGFLVTPFGADFILGMATNGTDFWFNDQNDDFIYHTDYSGNNQSDGFSTEVISGSDESRGVVISPSTGTPTDYWFVDNDDDFVYHISVDTPPTVTLQTPTSPSSSYTGSYVNFSYNVTSSLGNTIDNCSLFFDGILNQTDTSIHNKFNGTGQVGEWLFEGSAGDTSGEGNDGVVTGATLTSGHYGQGYEFDGDGDYITIPYDDSLNFTKTGNFSISMWINPEEWGGAQGDDYLFYQQNGGLTFWHYNSTNLMSCSFYEMGTRYFTDWSGHGIDETSGWTNILCLYNQSQLCIYKNGIQGKCDTEGSHFPNSTLANSFISFTGASAFNGTIDEVAIYNRALSEDEITDLYNIGLHTISQSINLTAQLPYGDTMWKVRCWDNNSISGTSHEFNYSRIIAYPFINLQYPENNSNLTIKDINFTYNVSIPAYSIDSCNLWLNDSGNIKLNTTDNSITQIINQSINLTLNNSHYWNWLVECESTVGIKENSTMDFFSYNSLPTTPIISPVNNTFLPRTDINLTCSGSSNADGDIINYEFWGGTDQTSLSILQNSSLTTYNWTSLTPDHRYWRCRANDNITNSGWTNINKFTTFDLFADCSGTNSTSLQAYNFTVQHDNNATSIWDYNFEATFTIWGNDSTVTKTVTTSLTMQNNTLFCIAPKNDTSFYVDAIISYSKTGYDTRNYFFGASDILESKDHNITLYLGLSDDSTAISITVTNSEDMPLNNIEVQAWQYDIGTDTDYLVQTEITDVSGELQMNLILNEFFTFRFYQDGVLVDSTTRFKLVSTSVTFKITTAEDPLAPSIDLDNLDHEWTWDNATKNITFSFSNADLVDDLDLICWGVDNLTHANDSMMYNFCWGAGEDSGMDDYIIGAGGDCEGYFRAYAYVFIDGIKYQISYFEIDLRDINIFGGEGLVLGLMLVLGLGGLGLASRNPSVTIAMVLLAVIINTLTTLWLLPWYALASMIVVGIIFMIISQV